MNILIVDDEEVTIMGIKKLIKWEQIGVANVMIALSGKEAWIISQYRKNRHYNYRYSYDRKEWN